MSLLSGPQKIISRDDKKNMSSAHHDVRKNEALILMVAKTWNDGPIVQFMSVNETEWDDTESKTCVRVAGNRGHSELKCLDYNTTIHHWCDLIDTTCVSVHTHNITAILLHCDICTPVCLAIG